MKRLAYAIARGAGPESAETLARVAVEGVAIVHGPAPASMTPGLDEVRDYAEVVARLHARETILPLRYGGMVATEGEMIDAIRHHRAEWLAALDRVEGCDEMGLRVLLDAPSAPASLPAETPGMGSGAAYLHRSCAEIAGTDAIRDEAGRVSALILAAMGDLHRAHEIEMPGEGRGAMLSMVFLVPRDRMAAFREVVAGLEGRGLGRLLLTGPWPPYGFAGA